MKANNNIEIFHGTKDGDTNLTYIFLNAKNRQEAREIAHDYYPPEEKGRWCCFKAVEKGKQIPTNPDESYTVPEDGFTATYKERIEGYPYKVEDITTTDRAVWKLFHTQNVKHAVRYALDLEKSYDNIIVECMCQEGSTIPIGGIKYTAPASGTIIKFEKQDV